MISVPEEIKELLHKDTCQKNIRIHFPNGERTDICNDLIVRDSVSFTESLCSQDNLKFGLCESPVFECEVVGVGNIKGATIEVTCEVYCSASDEGAEFKPDIKKYVYPIPLGTFVVQEAKRQADMQHRKIVAYNTIIEYVMRLSDIAKSRATYPSGLLIPFTQDAPAICCEIARSNIYGGTETDITLSAEAVEIADFNPSSGHRYTYKYMQYRITPQNENKLYRVFSNVKIPDYCFEYSRSYYASALPDHQYRPSWNPFKANNPFTSGPFQRVWLKQLTCHFKEYIYPYMSLNSQNAAAFYSNSDGEVYIRVLYEEKETTYSGTVVKFNHYCDPSDIHFKTVTFPFSFDLVWLREIVGNNKYAVVDPDSVNLRSTLSDLSELMGLFCGVNRFGEVFTLNIKRQFHLTPSETLYPGSSVYPEGVTGGKLLPEDYQSCWYDDDYTLPYGAITCEYKNSNNENCIYTLYLTGITEDTDPTTYRVYQINNNEIIRDTLWTEQQIADICNTIAANIDGVQYMPVEFTGRGLPYVEAGDTFEILTKSGDAITTIVLNRTLTGEQVMTDKYKSV